MAAPSNFEYPTLKRSEIVQILAQFEIASISDHDITNPKSAVVLDLYIRILNHLGFLDENDEQLDFDVLEHLDDPNLHAESVRVLKVYNKIKEVIHILQCPKKFHLGDLVLPDPARTVFFLGALLNFLIDRDRRMNSISELVEEVSTLEQKIVDIEENQIMQLNLAIEECKEAREREIPLVQEVDTKVKELQQTVAELNKKQSSLRSDLSKLKEKTKEIDKKISVAQFSVVQNVQENANLRSKIAQSPDKVQRALEEKKIAREEARNAERLAMQTFHEKNTLVNVFSKVNKKVSKHCKQILAIEEQVNSAKSVEKNLKALKAKLGDEEVQEKTLETQLVERQSKVEHIEGLKKQLEKKYNIVMEEGSKLISNKKSEVESKRSEIETRERDVENVLSKVDAVNSKITSVKESSAVKKDELDSTRREVVEAFRKYCHKFARVAESAPKFAGFDNLVSI
ncbi:kinetochore protein NUF2 homolog [Vicia villosa]|uniref:kinetochore protein NUF2 homolog n=1 Tax=Vicia villosa TaxID=3911 RepID=UPI00273B57A8|nr:kinetochore protein NUF2 homolog [Vicia villosa]